MIKIQTFDNFLTPLRFFRPWKAVMAVNDDAAYHFFRQNDAGKHAITSYTYFWEFLVLVLVLVLESKGSITRLLLVFAHEKLPFYLPTERQKAKINNEANKIFIFFLLRVAGKRNLQCYSTEHNETCEIQLCMYIYKFLSGTGQSENISELIHEKDFFKIFEIIYFSQKCLSIRVLIPYEKGRNTRPLV